MSSDRTATLFPSSIAFPGDAEAVFDRREDQPVSEIDECGSWFEKEREARISPINVGGGVENW